MFVMGLAIRMAGRLFGPVGVSVLGAVVHNLVQLGVAYFFVKNTEIFIFIPVFITTGVVTGAVVGLVSLLVYEAIGHRFDIGPLWPERMWG